MERQQYEGVVVVVVNLPDEVTPTKTETLVDTESVSTLVLLIIVF